jgi:phosphonate transport system substrate-binding protein
MFLPTEPLPPNELTKYQQYLTTEKEGEADMFIVRGIALFATLLMLTISTGFISKAQADWRKEFKEVKIGILSGENEKDRIKRYSLFAEYMTETLGVPVKIFTASSYAGVMQAMAADQIEFAFYGSSSYAGAWKETDGGVIPLAARIMDTGSTGYYSVVVVRTDSPYKKIDDLKGKTLAFADPNSTSGYAVPYATLKKQGYDPETFFGSIPFSGAHETGVLGVYNGQYDAAATNIKSETAGHPQRMAEKGMIKPGSIKWIWKSDEITNGPFTARKNLPQELIDAATLALLRIAVDGPEAYEAMREDGQVGYIPVNHKRYEWIVELRDEIQKMKRERASN